MVVEERGWLTDAECTSLIGLCQLMPGPNIVNFSVALGRRFRGLPGAVVAFSGLVACPFAIVLTLGYLSQRFGDLPALARPIGNLGAAAAGLVWAAAAKMAAAHWKSPRSVAIIVAGVAALAVFHLPLIPVVLVLAPASLLLQAERAR
jgi:chromate transporter